MSLVKSPVMTTEKLAANQANARQSHGPATPEGMERMRESNIRHGVYARPPHEALHILGEDAAKFDRLYESLKATWEPADELQEMLVKRLARALWRLERSDRVQESLEVQQVREVDRKSEIRAREACQQYENAVANLNWLFRSVSEGGEEFSTGDDELEVFRSTYGEAPEGRARQILICLNLLLEQPDDEQDSQEEGSGAGSAATSSNTDEDSKVTLQDILEGRWSPPEPSEDDDVDPLVLSVPIAGGPEERTEVRERLTALLHQELQAMKATRDAERERALEAAPYVRDSAIAPRGRRMARQTALMSRTEDSQFRQATRIIDILLKLKAGLLKPSRQRDMQNANASHDVYENE